MGKLAGDGVLLVMPTPATGATGPVAVWLTAAGWAKAAAARWGHSWLVTPEGVLSSEEAITLATRPRPAVRDKRGWRRHVPRLLGTAKKDLRDLGRALSFRNAALHGPWDGMDLAFVVQHHEIFQWAGFVAARRLAKPLVLFVDAPLVWEAERWGLRRPGWGRLIERVGEVPQLVRADLVACVSDEVAREVVRLGAPEERVLVTPCAADVDKFSPAVSGLKVRERYGLQGDVVVGWVGSFRRFHGLDLLLRAFALSLAPRKDAALLLVGDGFERPALERMARDMGIRAVFTGSVAHDEVPTHLAAMDVAVVVDPGRAGFHYSPLKLREYMASGLAVVAPRSGQPAQILANGDCGVLVAPGDEEELARALAILYAQGDERRRLGDRARRIIAKHGTWSHQIERVEQRLAALLAGEGG